MPVELRIALLIALFAAGLIARRRDWLAPPQAGVMLRLVITVGLPALFMADVSRIELRADLVALPLSSLAIMLVTLGISLWAGRVLQLSRAEQGAFTLCGVSINNGFLFPFVIAVWGAEGFAQMALFDFGHVIGQSTFVYALAAWYGGHGASLAGILRRIFTFPPLWAVLAALTINASDMALPEWLVVVLRTVGQVVLLLVIVALGVLFDARLLGDGRVLAALALRIALGLALGLLLAWAFGLEASRARCWSWAPRHRSASVPWCLPTARNCIASSQPAPPRFRCCWAWSTYRWRSGCCRAEAQRGGSAPGAGSSSGKVRTSPPEGAGTGCPDTVPAAAGAAVVAMFSALSPVLRASDARNRLTFCESVVTTPFMMSEGRTSLRP
jgi:predicted permease